MELILKVPTGILRVDMIKQKIQVKRFPNLLSEFMECFMPLSLLNNVFSLRCFWWTIHQQYPEGPF